MKTTNLDPAHQGDTTRGRKNTNLSGTPGQTFRDATTTADRIYDLTVSGATILDNDDGTAVLVIGPSATSVTVTDTGGYFTGTTLEAVLAELGARAYVGEILISDTAGSPLIFSDLLQNDIGADLIYADP